MTMSPSQWADIFPENMGPSGPSEPNIRVSIQEMMESEKQARRSAPSFRRLAHAAVQSEFLLPKLNRLNQLYQSPIDPNFVLTPELLTQLLEGLPTEYAYEFDHVTSLQQAETKRDQLVSLFQQRQMLASAGVKGAALRIGAAILDPVAIGVETAAVSVFGPAAYSTKISRLQRAWRAGLLFTPPTTAIMALHAVEDPDYQFKDVAYTAFGAMALGALTGAVLPGMPKTPPVNRTSIHASHARFAKSAKRGQQQIEIDDARALAAKNGEDLTPEGAAAVEDAAAANKESFKNVTDPNSLDLPENALDEVFGAIDTEHGPLPTSKPRTGDVDVDDVDDAAALADEALDAAVLAEVPRETGFLGRLRFSIMGRLMRVDDPLVRWVARFYGDDANAHIRPGDTLKVEPGSVVGRRDYQSLVSPFYTTSDKLFDGWIKNQKFSRWKWWGKRQEFMNLVGPQVRRTDGGSSGDKYIDAMADYLRGFQKNMLKYAKKKGIPGFDDIEENASYLMRVWRQGAIQKHIVKYSQKEVVRLIAEAFRRGSTRGLLSDEEVLKISEKFLLKIQNLDDYNEMEMGRIFRDTKRGQLALLLREAGLGNDAVDNIIKKTTTKGRKGEGGMPRTKHRMELDEKTSLRLEKEDGTGFDEVSIEDLLENNVEVLIDTYTRQITGAGALTGIFRAVSKKTGKKVTSFEQVKSALIKSMNAAKISKREVEMTLNRLELMNKVIGGYRVGGDNVSADTLRVLRAYNYLRVAGQFGIAQIPETALIASEMGFRAMIQQMPILNSYIRRARDGTLSNELLKEIEAIWGAGTDRLRNQAAIRFDDTGNLQNHLGDGFEAVMNSGERFIADASLMSLINMTQQRWAAAAGAQKWYSMAMSGKMPSAKRLGTMLLDKDDAQAIMGQLKKHATPAEQSLLGPKIGRLNIDKWDDANARAKFITSMDRWTGRVVQRNDIGQMSMWMTSDLGKTIIQFRSFMVGAYEKHLLFNLRIHDFESFLGWGTGMLLGTMVYTAQTYMNTLGREDRDEVLEDRLSIASIAKGGFNRSAFSSLLPMVADTFLPFVGAKQQFTFARTSGLGSGMIFGNPTVDLIDRIPAVGAALIAPGLRTDYDFSQTDSYNLTKAAPFGSIYGVRNISALFSQGLPRRSHVE